MSFELLGLQAELLKAVADEGYATPTPVQERTIPVILEGRDVLAGGQTGTRKTIAPVEYHRDSPFLTGRGGSVAFVGYGF